MPPEAVAEQSLTLDDLKEMARKKESTRPAGTITDPEKLARVWAHINRESALLKWAIEEIEAMDAFIKAHHGKTHRQVEDDEIPF